MDEQAVRLNLAEVKAALARNEEERDILTSLLRGFEGWLRLNSNKAPVVPQLDLPLPVKTNGTRDSIEILRVPARGAVLRVLKEARGEPLHVREILLRIRGMGARVKEDNPEGMCDLMAYSLRKDGHPLEKSGPRTWRWLDKADDVAEQATAEER